MLHEYDVHNHYNTDKYVNNGDKFWQQCNVMFIMINYAHSYGKGHITSSMASIEASIKINTTNKSHI
jgi:hypothetical protein